MPGKIGVPADSRATRLARSSSLTVRGRQGEARSSPRVAGRPGGGEAGSVVERTTAGSGIGGFGSGGQRRTSCSGRQSRGPGRLRRQRLGAPGLLALEVERRQPDAIGELVADAPGEVLEPALPLVPGRDDRGRQPLDVAVDVAGDRPEVMGRLDPAPVIAEDEDQPEARELVLGRVDWGRAEAFEDVLEPIAPDGRQHPVAHRERPDRDPRPLAPGAAGPVVEVGDDRQARPTTLGPPVSPADRGASPARRPRAATRSPRHPRAGRSWSSQPAGRWRWRPAAFPRPVPGVPATTSGTPASTRSQVRAASSASSAPRSIHGAIAGGAAGVSVIGRHRSSPAHDT